MHGKPENLLIDGNGNIKLCDFGWCGKIDEARFLFKIIIKLFILCPRSTFCGTLDYLSPEILEHANQDEKTDIWCLGILLYELVLGYPPFVSKNLQDKLVELKFMKVTFSPKFDLTEEFMELITQLLKKKSNERPFITEIFSHPWMIMYANKLQIDISKYLELSQNSEFRPSTLKQSINSESKNGGKLEFKI